MLSICVLVKPENLKINNSFLFKVLIKKNWVDIKKINGKMSKIIAGVFIKDKNNG